jgi:GH43 family beta-xylosidase
VPQSRSGPESLPDAAALVDDHPVPVQLRRSSHLGSGALTNPVIDTGPGRDHGDPFVLRWHRHYFLYYTGLAGIEVWTSSDLAHWTPKGVALAAPDGDHWAQVDLWAPEVLHADGWFYMYVTGTRALPPAVTRVPGVGVDSGDDGLRRQGLARARDPLGPFVLDEAPLLDVWSIDGHPFVDVDGRRWLFYNVRDTTTRYRGEVPGCGNFVDELVAPDTVRGEPAVVALPDAAWEGNRAGTWYWNEGPTVLRRRGRYVQMYSGGWYGDASYGVGFATAESPRGPWVKAGHNRVFMSGGRITGPGHHSVTVGPDGVTPYAVYHGYVDGAPGRKVHVDRLHWSTEGPRIGSGASTGVPTEGGQPVPEGPVYDRGVPYWHAELWAEGTRVRLGDLSVALPVGRDALIDVTQRGDLAWVLLEGRRVADGVRTGDPDRVALGLLDGSAVDGAVTSLALTTWREGQDVRLLGPGEVLEVGWGGRLPVEACVAVHGQADVRLVSRGTDVASAVVAPGGALPELVRLRAEGPVEALLVVAGPDGAVVSDVVLTARPKPRNRTASMATATAEIPLARRAADT